jgi:hypothetical protein
MEIERIHHINFTVGNSLLNSSFYNSKFQFTPLFYRGLDTGDKKINSHVVQQNDIKLVFTSSKKDKNNVYQHYKKHGENSVFDIAFEVVIFI